MGERQSGEASASLPRRLRWGGVSALAQTAASSRPSSPFLKPPHSLGSASIAQAPGRLHHIRPPRPAAPKLPRRWLLLLVAGLEPLEQAGPGFEGTAGRPRLQSHGRGHSERLNTPVTAIFHAKPFEL